MQLPKQVTITHFLHVKPDYDGQPVFKLFQCNMAGVDGFAEYACLGQVELIVDVPQIDPLAAMVAGLERQIEAERAASHQRINVLLDRISKLQSLEHLPGGDA